MSVLLSPWSKRSAAIGSILLLLAACSDDGDDFVTPGNGLGGSEYDADAGTLKDLRDGGWARK